MTNENFLGNLEKPKMENTEIRWNTNCFNQANQPAIVASENQNPLAYENQNQLQIAIETQMIHSEIDNESHMEGKFFKDFEAMVGNKETSDVTLIVDGCQFYVHQLILAARSPAFKRFFDENLKELTSSHVTINDRISKEAFSKVLRFIYTGNIVKFDDHALEIFAFSHLYAIEDLKEICEIELFETINEQNALDIFQNAHRYGGSLKLIEESFKIMKMLFRNNNYDIPDAFIHKPNEVQSAFDLMTKLSNSLSMLALTENNDKEKPNLSYNQTPTLPQSASFMVPFKDGKK
jgi:hypothetical protein